MRHNGPISPVRLRHVNLGPPHNVVPIPTLPHNIRLPLRHTVLRMPIEGVERGISMAHQDLTNVIDAVNYPPKQLEYAPQWLTSGAADVQMWSSWDLNEPFLL
jgi:hypothetical protein